MERTIGDRPIVRLPDTPPHRPDGAVRIADRMMPAARSAPSVEGVMDVSLPATGPGPGILARGLRLDLWLHIALVTTTLASTVRYLSGHGLGDRAPVVLTGAGLLLSLYGAHAADPRRRDRPIAVATAWCVLLLALWLGLVVVAPSFSWVAVPLAFVALQVLPFGAAAVAIVAMTVVVAAAWTSMQHRLDPTVVVGPIAVATLTVVAYRSLEREATTRRRLLEELRDAQGELSEAQHVAGRLAERARLSREIHDSVAQGFSSINLLLQAAEQSWDTRPAAARDHVEQAARTARDGLDEVRRVVRDLAPSELSPTTAGAATDAEAFPAALRRTCEQAVAGTELAVQFHVDGDPFPVPAEVAIAVLRTTRGALANVVEHARASQVAVSLTYQPDELILDVCDDGRGFDPDRRPSGSAASGRGRGLAGIAERAVLHGGRLVVESAPGAGTTLALSLPVAPEAGR